MKGARRVPLLALSVALSLSATNLHGQGLGLDGWSAGPLLLHDHVTFAFHQPALGDPYPHEFKQGYAFDGADLQLRLRWRWDGLKLGTTLRVTPASRAHWAYDQDTDFRPGDDFTHGNAGVAKSRTFGLGQSLRLGRVGGLGEASLEFDFLRQWTRYHAVTTYNLNSDPSLPSQVFPRLISERAIVYEYRPGLALRRARARGKWTFAARGEFDPISLISLDNYIPVILATSSTTGFGGGVDLEAARRWGGWRISLAAGAREEGSYAPAKHFQREEFALSLGVGRVVAW